MKTLFLSVASLLGLMAQPLWGTPVITDDFSKYPGAAGSGDWVTAWDSKVNADNLVAASSTTSPLSGGADYLVVTSTPTASLGMGSVNRAFDSSSGGISSESPYTITFDFRPDLPLGRNDGYNIYSATSLAPTTSINDIWQIRGIGRGWYIDSGDGTGGIVAGTPVMPVIVGTTYHFTVKVDPPTKTWKVTINDGSTTYESGPINFRTVANASADRTYLQFGASFGNDPTDSLTFSLDSISISATPKPGSEAGGTP